MTTLRQHPRYYKRTPPGVNYYFTPEQAQEALIDVERLGLHIARRLQRRFPRVNLDEILSEVHYGFLRAARYFEPDRGMKFSSFAARQGEFTARRFCLKRSRDARKVGSIDTPLCDTDGVTIADGIPGREEEGPPERPPIPADVWDFPGLPARSADVLRWRFREGLTLSDCGVRLGFITKERVRQIEAQALKSLASARPDLEKCIRE